MTVSEKQDGPDPRSPDISERRRHYRVEDNDTGTTDEVQTTAH